jgi:hypothetical protein
MTRGECHCGFLLSLRAEGVAISVGYRLLRHVVPRNDEIKIPLNPPLEKGVQRPRKGGFDISGKQVRL